METTYVVSEFVIYTVHLPEKLYWGWANKQEHVVRIIFD
jgi:hypothetical protein